uniref:20 kDa chaperonin, chloroplastic n=1 Tax=Haptolina brevifila TaxID=156173 RepID=A0A7S2IT45_9EUKA|mmetsp:Transcript_70698/g.140120  ORF Transcript_70698/g.140120 Transcript_70698/m.140120 type:complete len:239 (+) Transcript_70698:51-767(+)|eukprot:CAMPEP_0174721100 /NCGR_PEP_ID=MMETSP1094-20130205/35311_1 /TAXON_ID=156173 /ORGANISM="Chrysochromulina brevifilum, Strain UTEX LB 985" /LENGTH=238 /DNA_ID=CAMNT_0015921721 /DNA_START=44 /DNA_END=760 /DNA_ORIENTATION=+
MSIAILSLFSLTYNLGPPPTRPHLRSSSCAMEEYRLNNYILPGPMKPLGNQVLVKPRKLEDKTDGGLFVPTAESEKPKEAFVIAAGPGEVNAETGELIGCPVKEGDLVLLSDFVGENVDYNGEKHVFVDANNLLGTFSSKELSVSSFTPLGDRVMVAVAEAAKETTTGIALALDDDEDSNQGEVVAVGPGKYTTKGVLQPVGVSTGECVMFNKYAGSLTKMDGKTFKIVFESECIAKW